ncbi:hypothetical protein C0Q70_03143 [Pomacea canaliculata]|uniref:Uncharacterized protein n=2 Tax=Pomacea canaliculata TaxID=400727 RepID=A0A2T7PRX5_POMCA|nr:hypothetical protein C0Q70_03143 [Pomacea canaliculata]
MTNQNRTEVSTWIMAELTDFISDVQTFTISMKQFRLNLRAMENQYTEIMHQVINSLTGRSMKKKVFTLQNDLYALKDEIQALDNQLTTLRISVIPRHYDPIVLDLQRGAPRLIMSVNRSKQCKSSGDGSAGVSAVVLHPGEVSPAGWTRDPERMALDGDIAKENLSCVEVFPTKTDLDIGLANITSLVTSSDGLLIMTDFRNESIKVTPLDSPQQIHELNLQPNKPLSATVFVENQVAVTLWNTPMILLLRVTSKPLSAQVVHRLETVRVYSGVTKGAEANTLIVSANVFVDSSGVYPPTVDVISLHDGAILTSLSREPWASDLSWHHYLCTTKDGFVLVPNRTKGIVMKVRISTGKQLKRFIHPAMRGPRQVTIDENDNIYVACFDSRCVLLLTKLGIWRQVVSSEELPRNLHPHAVCVYQSKMYVAGKGDNGNICVFSLPYFMYHQ